MDCPRCRSALTLLADQQGYHGCAHCDGAWLNNEACTALLEMRTPLEVRETGPFQAEESGDTPTVEEAVAGPYRSKSELEALCPECGHRLDSASRLGVELIICIRHGSWFDRGKLRTLARRLSFDAATQRAHQTTALLAGVAEADRMIADAKRQERRARRRTAAT